MPDEYPDVVIAGGGIIGLSAALELAERGARVTVLERGTAMREASWAAAGMLAAGDPENPSELLALSRYSLAQYPAFLERVRSLSGMPVPLRTSGTLQALPAGHTHPEALSRAAIETKLPGLREAGRTYIWLDEHSLDPRDLCAALPLAARAAGVTLLEDTPVTSVQTKENGTEAPVAVHAGGRIFHAGAYLHCCGAWAGQAPLIAALPLSPALPVAPRKGQMIAVTLPAGLQLPWVIRTPELYLVPRGDGRVIIGATVEQAGFDRSINPVATDALLAAAGVIWPPVLAGRITDRWSGLRPGTPDALPILGKLLRDESMPAAAAQPAAGQRCWTATGHFRNGILLAPGTARLLAQLVLGETPDLDLAAFSMHRFLGAAEPAAAIA